MERSGSQKFLLVISILDIIMGILILLGAILLLVAGVGSVAVSSDPAAMAEAGVTATEAAEAGGALGILGFFTLLSGGLCLLQGILGLRAANDNQKIMPVWVLAIIGLVGAVITIVVALTDGSFSAGDTSSLGSLVGSGLMFWVANNIKKQAGK